MYFPRKQFTQPAGEPLGRDELKLQLYKTNSEIDQDALIDSQITAARIQFESDTNRQLMACQWDVYPPSFPGYGDRWPGGVGYPDWAENQILLPLGNLISVDSFAHTDTAGTTTPWTISGGNLLLNGAIQAHIDTVSEPARIALACGQVWPNVVLKTVNPIAIRITCGFADASAVPEPMKQAIRMLVAHWYENREATSVGTLMQSGKTLYAYDAIVAHYKLHAF